MIELENLSVVLPGFCLKALTLTVNEGEFFMIVGPTVLIVSIGTWAPERIDSS